MTTTEYAARDQAAFYGDDARYAIEHGSIEDAYSQALRAAHFAGEALDAGGTETIEKLSDFMTFDEFDSFMRGR